jgi:transcriptional regulator with XRE-family HTH domain
MIVFLKNLDYLLWKNRMSRADLARAINVPPSTINSWFARDTDKVKLQALSDTAKYFGVTMEWLVNGDENIIPTSGEDFTDEEIRLINDFCQMIKKRKERNE